MPTYRNQVFDIFNWHLGKQEEVCVDQLLVEMIEVEHIMEGLNLP